MDLARLKRLKLTAQQVEGVTDVLRGFTVENLDGAQLRGLLRVEEFDDGTSRRALAYLSLEPEFSEILNKLSTSVTSPFEFRYLERVEGLH